MFYVIGKRINEIFFYLIFYFACIYISSKKKRMVLKYQLKIRFFNELLEVFLPLVNSSEFPFFFCQLKKRKRKEEEQNSE